MTYPIKKISEICEIQRGGSPRPIKDFITDDKDGINWIKIGDTKKVNKFIYETNEKIRPEGIKKSRMVYPGDFILSNSMSFGKPYIMKTTGCIHDGWLVLRTDKDIIDDNFLYLLLGSNIMYAKFSNATSGTTVQNLSIDKVKNIEIKVPPLSTQKLIVQKLDSAFKNIDESIKITKKNIENIEELNKSVLEEVFVEGKYEMKSIGDIVEFGPKKSETKLLDETTDVSFVPMKYMNVKKMFFDSIEIKKLKDVYKGYTYFKDNDVLLAKVTPCFENGKSGIAKNLTNGIGFGSSEYYVFRSNNNISKEWIYYAVTTDKFLKEGANNMSGAVGLKRVTKEFILNYKIPLPPREKQKEIVSYLDEVFEKNKVIREGYESKLKDLEEMRQSILKEAFEGRLVGE
ncbi:MAG: hypothetical protein GY828_04570 [Candidatus Gracilibacteria bacterium]|nr:hypothetical protein [Candidatus Gracilibacteria bacterium]